jgi:hypothetical protein
LLSAAQLKQLKVDSSLSGSGNDEFGSLDCSWSGSDPSNDWLARAIVKKGAEYYLGSVTGAQVVQVAGFPAVQTASPDVDPAKQCQLFIDVAPGQSLQVQYANFTGDYPGISHQVACQQASKAAELMIGNLKKLAQ